MNYGTVRKKIIMINKKEDIVPPMREKLMEIHI